MDFDNNAVVLTSEPLKGFTPADMRKWLRENDTENGLASVFASVHNQTGWLGHDLDELNEPELSVAEAAYNEWWKFQEVLYKKIITILQRENDAGFANHTITEKGLHYVVKPFMERNGYRDGGGWWVNGDKK